MRNPFHRDEPTPDPEIERRLAALEAVSRSRVHMQHVEDLQAQVDSLRQRLDALTQSTTRSDEGLGVAIVGLEGRLDELALVQTGVEDLRAAMALWAAP